MQCISLPNHINFLTSALEAVMSVNRPSHKNIRVIFLHMLKLEFLRHRIEHSCNHSFMAINPLCGPPRLLSNWTTYSQQCNPKGASLYAMSLFVCLHQIFRLSHKHVALLEASFKTDYRKPSILVLPMISLSSWTT